jgi:hypothetical protein
MRKKKLYPRLWDDYSNDQIVFEYIYYFASKQFVRGHSYALKDEKKHAVNMLNLVGKDHLHNLSTGGH